MAKDRAFGGIHSFMKKIAAENRKVPGPVVLLIWDGFGFSKHTYGNAVRDAKMPTWHKLQKAYPNSLLRADAEAVGLTPGEAGNSEAGHATIGAGRPVLSDKVLINRAIDNYTFDNNPAFLHAAAHVVRRGSALHLMGLLTNRQSGHASFQQIEALVKWAMRLKLQKVNLHVFTDGRDTAPFHAAKLISDLERILPPSIRIATICGRFYAMDRDRNWNRTALAYHAVVHGEGLVARSSLEAVEAAYARGESDEFILPTTISGTQGVINDHDAVIFWNLRSDRARQLIKPFIEPDFERREKHAFKRKRKLRDLFFVTMTEFGRQIDGAVAAFPHQPLSGTVVEALRSLKQIYISESEKYSQVTYFMNGGSDRPRFGEERLRIPSAKISSFDRMPVMRAPQVARAIVNSVNKGYDFVCANFANPDMVGHTGNYQATKLACEAVDAVLEPIVKAVRKKRGALLITSDHGNAEEVVDVHGGLDTHHNANPVPFLVAIDVLKSAKARSGSLADVAPTVLYLLGVEAPKEMKGHNLLK